MKILYPVLLSLAIAAVAGCGDNRAPQGTSGSSGGTSSGTTNPPAATDTVSSSGPEAPDFTVTMLDGSTVRLSQLQGSPVVLHFWGVWCHFCKKEAPILQKMYETYQPQGIRFLPISTFDKKQQVADYLNDNHFRWPTGIDPRGTVAAKYRIRGYPTTILIDPQGHILKMQRGMAEEKVWVEMMNSLLAESRS